MSETRMVIVINFSHADVSTLLLFMNQDDADETVHDEEMHWRALWNILQ